VFDNALRELPVAGKTIADIGLDVVDKEESRSWQPWRSTGMSQLT